MKVDDEGTVILLALLLAGVGNHLLVLVHLLLESSEQAVMMLLDFTRKLDIISIVGAPVVAGDLLLNCGIVIQHGRATSSFSTMVKR